MAKRGLYILFEGFPDTVFDSQVLQHVIACEENIDIEFDILSVATTKSIYESSKKKHLKIDKCIKGSCYLLKGTRPVMPFSSWYNRRLLAPFITKKRYDFVHARTDYSAAIVGPLAHRRHIPLLWDCRGDSCAEFSSRTRDYRGLKKIAAQLRLVKYAKDTMNAAKYCQACTCVTHYLAQKLEHFPQAPKVWSTPCYAPENLFFFDADIRSKTRASLGYSNEHIVYVYSGSMAPYQCMSETVQHFKALYKRKPQARLLILTNQQEQAKAFLAGLDSTAYILTSVGHDEVAKYLNAADVAYILREKHPLNDAAFPTKFAEYAMTGLKVVLKDSPKDCVEVAERFGFKVPFEKLEFPSLSNHERLELSTQNAALLGRKQAMKKYGEIYDYLMLANNKRG
ncbi:hypothetical protein [Terasakiella pusilla]|uniref:hypothetical protein n=1 Tax=Terasakiella pusilla TaxID=64973 RepID=UPI0004919B12|nr:hypothetical protein [Terasakiella pusilla]